MDNIHVYQVMRAAGQIESILGLAERSRFEKPEIRRSACSRRALPIGQAPRLEDRRCYIVYWLPAQPAASVAL